MIVTLTILDLLVVGINVLADWLWSAEIERCTLYLQDFTCWDRLLIDREVVVCIHLTDDVVNSWGRICNTLDCEECVMSQVADGHLVSCSLILDDELIVVCQGVSYPNSQFSREAFLAVWAGVLQDNCIVTHTGCIPNVGVESGRTSMQMVLSIVACQLILLAMKGKSTLLDTISVTTDEDAQERLR